MNVHDTFTKAHTGLCSKANQSNLNCPPSFLNMLLNITVTATSDPTYKTNVCISTQFSDQCHSNPLPVRARISVQCVAGYIRLLYNIFIRSAGSVSLWRTLCPTNMLFVAYHRCIR